MSVRLTGPPERESLPALDTAALAERAGKLLRELGHAESELSVALVGDASMAEMNSQYRGRPGPTDVLSFSLLEGDHAEQRGGLLGDVVIDLEQAERQARERGHGLDEEAARLLIHGTLHLLGYDHEQDDEAREMEAMERRLWLLIGP